MTHESVKRAEAFKSTIEKKIQELITQFADGELSREQFHKIYERYSGQLAIANHAIASGNPDAYSIAQDGLSTIAMRDELMGKAMGLIILHNRSAKILETLGEFNIKLEDMSATIDDISRLMTNNQFIKPRVEHFGDKQWLLFVAARFSTVITEFLNEPSQVQIAEIMRLHHDFEHANRNFLDKTIVVTDKLAFPFIVFIKKKFGTS